MRYYLDTEFIERPCTIDLLSIALVREDGLEMYLVSSDCDQSLANDFVRDQVIPNLAHPEDPRGVPYLPRAMIAQTIREFVGNDPRPVFYAYYADYDWVAFCWLFGAMIDLPRGFPMYCRDLKQTVDEVWETLKIDLAAQVVRPEIKHNALIDARFNRRLHQYLIDWSNGRG